MKLCIDCGNQKSRKGDYCKPCGYKHRIRPIGLKYKIVAVNKGWFKDKGGWIDEKGYRKTKKGRKHILIMENYLKRKLLPNEVVHHINGNKLDNDIENLQLLTKKQHDEWHRGKRKVGKCII